MKLNSVSIRNILSIRYNPTEKPQLSPVTSKNFNETQTDPSGLKTKTLLKNALKNKLKTSNEPIAVSLSSGIDSTLCLSLLREIFPDRELIGICGVFENGFDESKQASKIAKKFNAKFKTVKMPSIYQTMPKLISITKKPKWNTYTHIIAKEAKKYSDIYVAGDGADEVFGGYTFRYSKFLDLCKPKSSWKTKVKNYLECHNRDWVPDQKNLFDKNLNFSWNKIFLYFEKYFSNPLPLLKQVMYADLNGKLYHDFQPNGQRIFSKYDLIGVQPFLNSKIIDFGIKLPIEELYDKKTGLGKLVLRKISKRMAVNHIDEKRGFSLNLLIDWKKNGKDICQEFLLDKNSHIYSEKIINFNWVKKAFNIVENDGNLIYLSRLISILALEVWFRIQFNELKPSQTLV